MAMGSGRALLKMLWIIWTCPKYYIRWKVFIPVDVDVKGDEYSKLRIKKISQSTNFLKAWHFFLKAKHLYIFKVVFLISPRSTNKTNFFLLHLLINNSNWVHFTHVDIFQQKELPTTTKFLFVNFFVNRVSQFEAREKLSWFWLQTLFKGRVTLLLLFSKKM